MWGKSIKQGIFRSSKRGLILFFCLTLLLMISSANILYAADYPTRFIQLIVAFPPGGGSDIVGRLISPKLSDLLGQPVVVVNKTGGGGVIGTYAAKAAPPDGYSIFNPSPPMILAPLVNKDVTFNLLRDFTMINLAVASPSVIIVRKDSPWKKLEELILEAQKNPGKLTCSGTGYGSSPHFAFELFKMHTATDITYVPMDGVGPALTGVLGGHTDLTITSYGEAYRYVVAGTLRALAVMDRARHKDLPDVPTGVEKGFPKLMSTSWQGYAVRSETLKVIVEKLGKIFKEALKDEGLTGKLEKTGWVIENLGLQEGQEFITKEQQKWLEVAKAANIVPK